MNQEDDAVGEFEDDSLFEVRAAQRARLRDVRAIDPKKHGLALSANAKDAVAQGKRRDRVASDGTNLYVSDPGNFAIRKIVIATAEVSTFAGGRQGNLDGIGTDARFRAPGGLAYDAGFLYVADTIDHTIRRIAIATQEVTTFMGAPGEAKRVDGAVDVARFSYPFKIVADGIGNLYVAELAAVRTNSLDLVYRPTGFGMIRRIDIAKKTVSVFAGSAGKLGFVEGALPATLNCPAGLAIDRNGDLVFTDVCDHVVGIIQAE